MDTALSVEEIVRKLVGSPEFEGYYLARFRCREEAALIEITLDTDAGLNMEDCIRFHRALETELKERTWWQGEYGIEVGSPGISNPLTRPGQYPKHIGRMCVVTLTDGTHLEGKLEKSEAGHIVIAPPLPEGKRSEKYRPPSVTLKFDNIKHTVIKPQF